MGEGRQGLRGEGRLNPVLVEALRGGVRESAHRGACAVVDADGGIVASLGDVERLVFPRSAVKLVQAIPLVASGAADRLGLDDSQLALACASHEGEPAHVDTARAMLAKAGLDERALECGVHWPYLEQAQHDLAAAGRAPSALHNNCSGKHAGFLCLACHMSGGKDVASYAKGYVGEAHPVMRAVTAQLAAATGCDPATLPRGVDGCAIPAYAFPLRRLALAFARVATGRGLAADAAAAAARLRGAVARHPHLVGGTDRFDTRVAERFGERVLTKVGAEGVFCAAFPREGLGVAIKIDDGTRRAAEVAMAAVVEALVPLDDGDAALLRGLSDAPILNRNGAEVGRLRALDEVREQLHR